MKTRMLSAVMAAFMLATASVGGITASAASASTAVSADGASGAVVSGVDAGGGPRSENPASSLSSSGSNVSP